MNAPPRISRRGFVVTSSLGMAALALRPHWPAMTTQSASRVVFDPAIEVSIRFASAARWQGTAMHALVGDPYRFILGLLANCGVSGCIAGISSFADFVLLTGTLQDARYRLTGHGRHGGVQGHAHLCFGEFTSCNHELRDHGDAWPEALADYIFGASPATSGRAATPGKIGARAGATVSWLMNPTSA